MPADFNKFTMLREDWVSREVEGFLKEMLVLGSSQGDFASRDVDARLSTSGRKLDVRKESYSFDIARSGVSAKIARVVFGDIVAISLILNFTIDTRAKIESLFAPFSINVVGCLKSVSLDSGLITEGVSDRDVRLLLSLNDEVECSYDRSSNKGVWGMIALVAFVRESVAQSLH